MKWLRRYLLCLGVFLLLWQYPRARPYTPQPPYGSMGRMWTLRWPDGHLYTGDTPDAILDAVADRPDCPDDMGHALTHMHRLSQDATGICTLFSGGTTAQHLWRLHEAGVFHVEHREGQPC